MGAGFGMHGDDLGTGIGESAQIGIGGRNHQMHVKGLRRQRPDGFDNIGAKADIGNEMPVHDIEMDQVGTSAVNGFHLFAQTGEVRSQ